MNKKQSFPEQLFRRLSLLLLIILFGLSKVGYAQSSSVNTKPNIVFIYSDDHSAKAVGAYQSRLAKLNPTPTIDKLAQQGMRFTNAFVTNSICTPARAVLETGQYSERNGVLDLDKNVLPPDKDYLPIELHKLGYETAIIGKWHLYAEPAQYDYYEVSSGQGRYINPQSHVKGEGKWPKNMVEHKGFATDVKTTEAIKWLNGEQGNRNKKKPFYLALHFHAPHEPWSYAKRYSNYLEDTDIPEPASMYHMMKPPKGSEGAAQKQYLDWNPGSIATRGKNDSLIHVIGSSIGRRNTIRNMGKSQPVIKVDKNASDREYMHSAYQQYLKRYLRSVKGVDDNVKRLIDYLKENDLYENTIVIYSSDQGMFLGEHDYYDKRWMYDPSMRVPLIIRYPKMINPGSVSDVLTNNTDFAPTLIDLAGGSAPGYMQGRSMKPILETGNTPGNWRTATYYRYWMHMIHHGIPAHFGIRTKRYKLIFFYGRHYNEKKMGTISPYYHFPIRQTPVAWEFYDLTKDPREMNNRYSDPEYQNVIARLKKKLKEVRQEYRLTDEKYPRIQQIIHKNWDK